MTKASILKPAVSLLGFAFVLYYAFSGYKKPHGNLLRYLMLAYGAILAIGSAAAFLFGVATMGDPAAGTMPMLDGAENHMSNMAPLQAFLLCLSILLIGYISGRLHKFEQNKWLLTLVLIMLLVRVLLSIGNKQNA